jgi:hypothetical protein
VNNSSTSHIEVSAWAIGRLGRVYDIFRFRNEKINTDSKLVLIGVYRVEIETIDDLRAVLKETGYSNKAVNEIVKWYSAEHPIK